MEAVKNNIPKLRFPDFVEPWEEKKLDDFLTFKNGVNAPKEKYGTGYRFINVLDIINNDFITHDRITDKVDIPDDVFEKNIVKYGDILFQRSSETREEVGQSNVYLDKDRDATFGGFVIRGGMNGTYEPRFMNYLLKTAKSRKEITNKSGGSTRYNVGQETLKEVKIDITSLPEQQKIAQFLSSVDTKIEQLTKKKQLLEQYKKGVMQQIFSQQLRFKNENGHDFPDWEVKKLGEIGTTINGLTGKTKEDFGTGKPYIQYKQVFDTSKIDVSKCDFVEILNNDRQTKVRYGDIFFTTSSETPNEIGTASVLLNDVDEMYLNSFCFGYRVDKTILNPTFSQFIFRSENFRKKMIPLAQGSTRYNISKSSFLKLFIELPCLEEQTQIANFLSAIDKKIDFVNTQLDKTQAFKKGLLQQMFV